MSNNRLPSDIDQQLDRIIRENYHAIYQYCFWKLRNAEEAQDITQEVFCRFINRADTYQEMGKVRAFLYTIARNLCINWKKHEAKFSTLEFEDKFEIEASYEKTINRIDLENCISKLPQIQQEIILLRFGQELSVEEIARILHTNRFAVYYQIKVALSKLRREYERGE